MLGALAVLLLAGCVSSFVALAALDRQPGTHCQPIYTVGRVDQRSNSIRADIDLDQSACAQAEADNVKLSLLVEYETDNRLHVLIQDRQNERFHVPEALFPRPDISSQTTEDTSSLSFQLTTAPFSFLVTRAGTDEVLFNVTEGAFFFKPQHLRLRTTLPEDPNIYGLGEHFDSFRMPSTDYKRTLWGRDGGVGYRQNLYGAHPVYIEHRTTGTHGVFLLNSNGMDVVLDKDDAGQNYLEYNVIGGVLDFYFLAGPSPVEVSKQYAEVAGLPAMIPYWTLGFHQCKSGYRDWIQVAEVIANYSRADIPLETMWTDIDHYNLRRPFTTDPDNFPLDKMRQIVEYLHDNRQQYVLIVDPAVADVDYPSFNRGDELDVFLKSPDPESKSEYFQGVVWPGVSVFPDWLHPNSSTWWTKEFSKFFDPKKGIDIDGVWIDMNEPASFCTYPCADPHGEAKRRSLPPKAPTGRDPPRPIPEFNVTSEDTEPMAEDLDEDWIRSTETDISDTDDAQNVMELEADTAESDYSDVLEPPYSISNRAGKLSDKTVHTDVEQYGGVLQYDAHNLYGLSMGMTTREAMLARRPDLKPFVLSRSTFAGAGKHVQKWLGDNFARWDHYRSSIAGLMAFASIFQIPMVGSDVCGFNNSPSEKLCARWATLGAFSPFYRNHATSRSPPQEFFLWPLVTSAARYAISIRYRLLDYIYTALQAQSVDGTPAINPLWYLYPDDPNTFGIDLQYFYGSCILVSPVTKDDATEVEIYLPDDVFYELETGDAVRGRGDWVHLPEVPFDRIPLHVRGGCVVPLRVESANTTAELRGKAFELVVAPGLDGKASGDLYVDDGVSLNGGDDKIGVHFEFGGAGEVVLSAMPGFEHVEEEELEEKMKKAGIQIEKIRVLGESDGEARRSNEPWWQVP